MGMRSVVFTEGEWYHCYSRTVDRAPSFNTKSNYQRFLQGMYLANSTYTINHSSFKNLTHEEILNLERGKSLVSIGAYALMPNHYHLLLRQERENGISHFMQRLGTSYCKYFNEKHQRIGNLFVKPFRTRHVDSDVYLQKVSEYVHLNPVDVLDRNWRSCNTRTAAHLAEKLKVYPFSSLPEYLGVRRPENSLVLGETNSPIRPFDEHRMQSLLAEAAQFYDEVNF